MKCSWLCLFLPTIVCALPPPIPGGGIVERQLEREFEGRPLELEKELPPVQIEIPDERLDMPSGMTVSIKSIAIRGTAAIPCREVERWVQCFLGKDLTLQDIYNICAKIDAEYAARGYFVARAYPPPQTIENGRLVLAVVEGKIGEIIIEGNHFYRDSFIRSYFSKLVSRALNYDSFMRALLLLNENTDLRAGAVLSKGKERGTVNIHLLVHDRWPGHLYLNANNLGKNLTTNWRAGARFDVGSLFTYGDTFSIAEVVGFPFNALYFTNLIYSIPLNRNGLTMDLSYLFSKFKVEELRFLKLAASSNIATIKMNQAVLRTRRMSIDVASWFDYMQIKNLEMGSVIAFDKLRVLRFSMLMDRFATPLGRDYLNLKMAVGIPNFLGGLSAVDPECSREGGGGLFVKFNGDYDRLQEIFENIYLAIHLTGQWSPYRLAVAEQLYLGGADTVRGYPLAVAVGDSGYYFNLEFRMPPPLLGDYRFLVAKKKCREVLQIVGFLDHGGVFLHGGSDTFETGIGVGARMNNIMGVSLSFDVGFPLTSRNLSSGAVIYVKVTACPF